MLFATAPREHLLSFMPKGGVVAEIGSFRGHFAQHIWDVIKPDYLHLIDPWEHQEREDYQKDESNLSNEGHEDNLSFVKERFAAEIESGRIVLQRAYSGDAAQTFADASFDWVYVDGLHTYQGVKEDLENYAPKVKESGFILGHDFTNVPGIDAEFGVVEAVEEFIGNGEFHMVALSHESAPTFFLHRNPESREAIALSENIVFGVPHVIDIEGYPGGGYIDKLLQFEGNVFRQVPSF